MVLRQQPLSDAKTDDKNTSKETDEERPRFVNGIRVAKASTIMRQGS